MTKVLLRLLSSLLVAFALLPSTAHCGQSAKKRQGKEDAHAFAQTIPDLVGKKKEEVIAAIGVPDSTFTSEKTEVWRYRKLFGAYQKRKVIFGHISLTWEVKVELALNDGVVQSVRTLSVREVHRSRDDVTQ